MEVKAQRDYIALTVYVLVALALLILSSFVWNVATQSSPPKVGTDATSSTTVTTTSIPVVTTTTATTSVVADTVFGTTSTTTPDRSRCSRVFGEYVCPSARGVYAGLTRR